MLNIAQTLPQAASLHMQTSNGGNPVAVVAWQQAANT
jgi:hypothetical protein